MRRNQDVLTNLKEHKEFLRASPSVFYRGDFAVLLCLCMFFSTLNSLLLAETKPAAAVGFATLAAKANAARDNDRLDEALTLYRKALLIRPGWVEGWWSIGTIEYDRDAYADAARALRKVTALSPQNGTAYVMLGLSEFELGRDELSLEHMQKGGALGLDKDEQLRKVVFYHEGVLLQRKGRFESAQETLEHLCLQNDDAATVLGMALLRMRSKNPPAAGSQDADVVLRVGRAECRAGQRNYDEARKQFSALLQQYPKYPGLHYAYGLFLEEASDPVAADAEFQEEVRNNPTDFGARLQIAAAMYKVDSAAGIPYAEEVVNLNPNLAFAHYLLGLLLLDTDNYEKALPELEIAQKAFPKEAKLYLALGSAYSRAGRKQEAARSRAMFERLTKEQANSTLSDGQGVRGGLEEKVRNKQSTRNPD